MANVLINEASLYSTADAIRSKNNETRLYKPSEMAAAILALNVVDPDTPSDPTPGGGASGNIEDLLTNAQDIDFTTEWGI